MLEHLGEEDCGWLFADVLFPAAACLAVFSSFSSTLRIPPSWKYSWQTLRKDSVDKVNDITVKLYLRYIYRLYRYAPRTCDLWVASTKLHRWSYLRHHSMRPSPSHLLAQCLSARLFMAVAYSLRVCSSSQCSRHIFSKSPTADSDTKQRHMWRLKSWSGQWFILLTILIWCTWIFKSI